MVFKNDSRALQMMNQELKTKTQENKDLNDEIEVQNKIFFGEEVLDIFKQQVMQGQIKDDGKVRYKAKKEHAMGARNISEGTQIPK